MMYPLGAFGTCKGLVDLAACLVMEITTAAGCPRQVNPTENPFSSSRRIMVRLWRASVAE